MREQELLQNVLNEIERLQMETQRLRTEATQHLNSNWFTESETLSIFFEKWRESIGSKNIATYAIKNGLLSLLPALSQNPEKLPALSTHALSHSESEITPKNENLVRQVRLALGSLDIHFDFAKKRIFAPIALTDTPCGIIIAELFDLEKSKYLLVARETATFIDALRTSLHAPNAKPLPHIRAS
jgi:hypothetical protein